MNLKSVIVETLCRNGRCFLSRNANLNVTGLTAAVARPGPSPYLGRRSLSDLSKNRYAVIHEGTTWKSWNCARSDWLLFNRCGLNENFVRTSTTQASPAEDISEGEKLKGSLNKTQVLLDEVQSLIASGKVTLVDVREPEEVKETGSLPGSFNIPLTKLKAALGMSDEEFKSTYQMPKPQKDDPNVIFYGLSSVKSSAAVEIAHKLGFKKSRHYPGGLEEWNQKGKKT